MLVTVSHPEVFVKYQELTPMALLKPYEATDMEFYPVDRAVNSPQHNSPDCIVPI